MSFEALKHNNINKRKVLAEIVYQQALNLAVDNLII